nr:extracellular solute-binding protein [Pseudomonas sp.]
KITTYAANLNTFGYTVQYAMLKGHGEKIWDWYKELGPHTKPENGAGPMAEKVASGEYVLAYLTGSASSWSMVRAPGGEQLLGWTYIDDGTPLIPRGVAVAKAAANPNAARLMLDYILSEEGQTAFATTHRTVLHPTVTEAETNGVQTYASVVEQVGAENILPVPYEEDMITGYDAFVANWKSAFGG